MRTRKRTGCTLYLCLRGISLNINVKWNGIEGTFFVYYATKTTVEAILTVQFVYNINGKYTLKEKQKMLTTVKYSYRTCCD